MSQVFDLLFAQYSQYPTLFIYLEATAIFFGILSVWFSWQNNVLVFPAGIISTSIFVYILLVSGLLGDTLINAYYFIMSIYGWFYWTRKNTGKRETPITSSSRSDIKLCLLIFALAVIAVLIIYVISSKLTSWTAYVDIFTTGVFFVGMWLMARRKIQHWLCWIVGDAVSVPLYAYKGLILTSIQFFVFTVMAILGYRKWLKLINEPV